MRHYPHITSHEAPDPATYVQLVGYHTLEDAYHRLLERGEVDIPRHNFQSFDLGPGEEVAVDDLDSPKFKFGTDKYDISAKLHDQQFNPKPAPKLDHPTPEPPTPEPPAPPKE